MTSCDHCNGQILPDVYGEEACLQCGRPPESHRVSLQECPECGCVSKCDGHAVGAYRNRTRKKQHCAVCTPGGAWRQRQRFEMHRH